MPLASNRAGSELFTVGNFNCTMTGGCQAPCVTELLMRSAGAAQVPRKTSLDRSRLVAVGLRRSLDARAPDFTRTPRLLPVDPRRIARPRGDAVFVRRLENLQLEHGLPGLIVGFHCSSFPETSTLGLGRDSSTAKSGNSSPRVKLRRYVNKTRTASQNSAGRVVRQIFLETDLFRRLDRVLGLQ